MNFKKIIISLFIILGIFFIFSHSFSASINFPTDIKNNVWKVSIDTNTSMWWNLENTDTLKMIEYLWLRFLHIFKVVIEWLLLVYIVYTWAMMIMSSWTNEEELSSAKRSFRYAIIWLIFVNIPWTIYETIVWRQKNITEDIWRYSDSVFWFINDENFKALITNIIQFIQVFIFFIAILLLTLSAIRLIMSRWRDEVLKEHKNNIFYSLLWLVFVWLIWTWKNIVFDWEALVEQSRTFFSQMANFVLLFAWPIAIFFLILAWYYFITASWDEDRIKKAKHIVVNVVLWTLILIASYTFLIDLNNFKLN